MSERHVSNNHPRALRRVGLALLALGALHVLVTVIGGAPVFAGMIADGLWNTAGFGDDQNPLRIAGFWSLMFGVTFVLLGQLLVRIARGGPALTRSYALAFTAIMAVGAVAVPVGGFWIAVAIGLWMAAVAGR